MNQKRDLSSIFLYYQRKLKLFVIKHGITNKKSENNNKFEGVVFSVTVIVVRREIVDPNSNPELGRLLFPSTFGKDSYGQRED